MLNPVDRLINHCLRLAYQSYYVVVSIEQSPRAVGTHLKRIRGKCSSRPEATYLLYEHFLKINFSYLGAYIKGIMSSFCNNQHQLPGYPGYKYLIFLKSTSVTTYQGTLSTTYIYLIYGNFPKTNISYQGTLGTTYQYLIQSITT